MNKTAQPFVFSKEHLQVFLDALHTQYQLKSEAIVPRNSPEAPTLDQLIEIRNAYHNITHIIKQAMLAVDTPPHPSREKIVSMLTEYIYCAMNGEPHGVLPQEEDIVPSKSMANDIYTIISPYLARGKE